jgi:single-strand DNA-binding protein
MSTRTITGNLAADPEIIPAGQIQITKFRVIENTGEYRKGEWTPHPDATTHFVEAKFELGENITRSLHKGDPVIVVGREYTASWGDDNNKTYGRVLEAEAVGPDLARSVADVKRLTKSDAN